MEISLTREKKKSLSDQNYYILDYHWIFFSSLDLLVILMNYLYSNIDSYIITYHCLI